jgi:hypothetical protein
LGQTGWIWCVLSEKLNDKFFRFKRGQNALGGGLARGLSTETETIENTPNMSFGSNGVDRVRSFQKHQHEFFRFIRGQNCPRGRIRTRFVDRNRNFENTPNMSFGSNGRIGSVRYEKINCKFFRSTNGQNDTRGGFRTSLSTETETAKTHQTRVLGPTGWIGCVHCEKSTTSFFVSTMAKTAPAGRFRMSFVDRNRNFENALDMSFGSNGEDWVQSFRKNQLQVFLLKPWPNNPSGAAFARVLSSENEQRKRTKHEFWVKRGGFGAFVSKNSTASFFASNVARTALGAGLARGLSTETETAKTHQT